MPGTSNLSQGSQRCAIYTRKSVEQGLEIEFNTLESQRAICSAYITSQRHKAWAELSKRYDDGGESGSNLMRPALQELLADIERGMIDVVVIYKLDRLTRTLLDFVRLIDLFDQYGVIFVSVTQNFDTAESTGRLILNILLTFAQFEREIAGDRLRDKFAAMRQRGMFVGGHPPFGYVLIDKKLYPQPDEAEVVRWLFQRYLEAGSYVILARECEDRGIIRRDRISKRGNCIRGRGIHASSIWNMLGNPVYIGEVRHRGTRYPGLHEPIVPRDLWDQVQQLRAKRTRAKVVEIYKTDLLRGLMFDSFGRLMGVLRDYRKDSRRYYISNQNEWGRRQGVRRMRTNADALEQLVLATLSTLLSDRERVRGLLLKLGVHDKELEQLTCFTGPASQRLERANRRQVQCAYKALISRIELTPDRMKIVVRGPEVRRFLTWDGLGLFRGDKAEWERPHPTELIDVPTSAVRLKRSLWLPIRQRAPGHANVPNYRLVRLLRNARAARDLVEKDRTTDLMALAIQMNCKKTRFARLVRLNYLAPDIITSILDGTQPAGLTARKLMQHDIPMDWTLQRKVFGFAEQPDYLKANIGY
jgi:site-specific DNA recombinase